MDWSNGNWRFKFTDSLLKIICSKDIQCYSLLWCKSHLHSRCKDYCVRTSQNVIFLTNDSTNNPQKRIVVFLTRECRGLSETESCILNQNSSHSAKEKEVGKHEKVLFGSDPKWSQYWRIAPDSNSLKTASQLYNTQIPYRQTKVTGRLSIKCVLVTPAKVLKLQALVP